MLEIRLRRRGFDLGTVKAKEVEEATTGKQEEILWAWENGLAHKMERALLSELPAHRTSIQESKELYEAILTRNDLDSLLSQEPYVSRTAVKYEALGSSFNEGNNQELETVFFDGIDGDQVVAEDLWIKLSWLSFNEDDKSVRFRFSFGVDFEEDVARDTTRQHYAAKLTELVFPESLLITQNMELSSVLSTLFGTDTPYFVERICYFNAPNGGAYLHHDRERGHAGVVYAQLTGCTYWLALPRQALATEIQSFVSECLSEKRNWPASCNDDTRQELQSVTGSYPTLIEELETFANDSLIHLINETAEFVQHLVTQGYGKLMLPGDLLLLPQQTEELCCWHTVFCVGDEPGQALSFAVRVG